MTWLPASANTDNRSGAFNRVRSNNLKWCHLVADTNAELLEFAGELELRQSWIQKPGTPEEHFDLTSGKRKKALNLGAIPVSRKRLVEIIRTKRYEYMEKKYVCRQKIF